MKYNDEINNQMNARYLAKKHGLSLLSKNNTAVFKAMYFCCKAHNGQKRKYTGEDYANHPFAVAKIIYDIGVDNNMIIAALLHDVVEDTSYTLCDIAENFGFDVSKLVSELTKITTPDDGNLAFRINMEIEKLSKVSSRAKTIKVADLIHNTESIVRHDPNFAKTYLLEKQKTLKVLKDGADSDLYSTAIQTLIDGLDQIYGIGNWEGEEDCVVLSA